MTETTKIPNLPFKYISIAPSGSSYICNPPVTNTDIDFAVLAKSLFLAAFALSCAGWEVTEDDPSYTISINGELPFITARHGVYNLIIFDTEEGYDAFVLATEVAKRLNVLDKGDRVALFQAVCGGRQWLKDAVSTELLDMINPT